MQKFLRPFLFAALTSITFGEITPLPDKVANVIPDRQDFQSPEHVQLQGWIGTRVHGNEANRLVKLDPARLLEGYRHRPGRQAWDGEHVGKWLHAATLAWVNTGDPALREKLDYVAAELCKCQLPDGYLGTYAEKDRWTEWDVWAHKYNLIGLITYMRYTGNIAPMETCRRMGDLLCSSFGDAPGQRDILKAGYHAGMAPTSVLEPMVLLYRVTGEPRYLKFCQYILRAWEQPGGPHIVSTLLTDQRVDHVGNKKAYEMLSCLNGAIEYYRLTGEAPLLHACENAWTDIVDHRLYITGAASHKEYFDDDFCLPNVDNVGETCVTVTWLQLNAQLLRITGDAKYAGQLEHVVLNQLFGAERPDCAAWGYYVQMAGKKPYSDSLDGHCCLSSGPRGVALIPTFAVTTDQQGIVCNLFEAGAAALKLRDGTPVNLTTETIYPADGRIVFKVEPASAKKFAVQIRIPAWCKTWSIEVNGQPQSPAAGANGYAVLTRNWQPHDAIELNLKLETRVVRGDHLNAGKVAFFHGPLVLAADSALQPGEVKDWFVAGSDTGLTLQAEPAPAALSTWPHAQIFRIASTAAIAKRNPEHAIAQLIPFADAGANGTQYEVWLKTNPD